MRGRIDQLSDGEIAKIVKESFSYAECLQKMGYTSHSGPVHKKFKEKIVNLQLSTSHFQRTTPVNRTRENIFVENSTCDQGTLRRWFLKENIPYKCSICGQEPFWNGKAMIMILDHINGKNHDDRLENLRWVCPNCNVQLPTNGSKNKKLQKDYTLSLKQRVLPVSRKQQHSCTQCGRPISKEGGLCRQCTNDIKRKTRPDFLTLAKMVKEHGFEYVGAQYQVSGKAIQKWFYKEGLPYHKKDVIQWYNDQTGIVTPPPKTKTPITEIVRPVHQIDPVTNEIIKTFPSAAAAGHSLNKKKSPHISSVCKGERATAYGYKWQYADT